MVLGEILKANQAGSDAEVTQLAEVLLSVGLFRLWEHYKIKFNKPEERSFPFLQSISQNVKGEADLSVAKLVVTHTTGFVSHQGWI